LHNRYVRNITNGYLQVKANGLDVFKSRANSAISECQNTIHTLTEGYYYTRPGSQFSVQGSLLRKTKKAFKATSEDDINFWRSIRGEKYLQDHQEAIKRGVKITRIFIHPESAIPQIIDVLQKQIDIGIEVLVVPADHISADLIQDFIIMDDHIVSFSPEFVVTSADREERISSQTDEVNEVLYKFNLLCGYSKPARNIIEGL